MGDVFSKDIASYMVPIFALNFVIVLLVGFLSFLFIKKKLFNDYSCYYIIIFNWIFLIDNLFRILPFDKDDKNKSECSSPWGKFQAFVLFLFDKLIQSIITSQTIIYYLGYYKSDSFFAHQRLIFFSTLSLSGVISLALSLIVLGLNSKEQKTTPDNQNNNQTQNFNQTQKENLVQEPNQTQTNQTSYYCYFGNDDSDFKITSDTILNTIYILINLYCILVLFRYISRKKKEAAKGLIEDSDYKHHYIKILIMLIINPLLFIQIYLIIFQVIHNSAVVDLLYLSILMIIDFLYSFNKIIYKETLKIFCKNIYKKKFDDIKTELGDKGHQDDEDDDEDENKVKRVRTDSF